MLRRRRRSSSCAAASRPGEDGQITNGEDGSLNGENNVSGPTQGDNTTGDNQTGSDTINWLDLTGHDEVSVRPSSVYDKYYIYYTTGRRESAQRPRHEL